MDTLNQDASEVIRGGRGGLRGTDADRERVEAALAARLGLGALPAAPFPRQNPRSVPWRLVTGAAIGACVVGGALLFTARPGPSAPPEPPPLEAQPAALPAQSSSDEPAAGLEAPVAPASASAEPLPAPARSGPPPQDALTQEVALLSRAISALNAGRAGDALKTLNEHQRQFPHGILDVDRRAAKAQALCSLGRLAEGRAELARLTPRSPAASRARQVCDAVKLPE